MSAPRIAAIAVLVVAAFAAGGWFSRRESPARAVGSQILYYQDPMHPAYRSDKPGIAPDCGMKLVPVYAGSGAPTFKTGDGGTDVGIRIDEGKQHLMGIRVAAAEMGGGVRVLHAPGRVSIDTGKIYVVNAASEGWFTSARLNVGDRVEKDQLLGSYFARELRAAALGHLAVMDRAQPAENTVDPERMRSDRSNVGLSLEILHNLGVSDAQIRSIEKTREVPADVDLRAPASGVIVARNASPGQRFMRGDDLYRIADLSSVWIIADLLPEDGNSIPRGSAAHVKVGNPARTLDAKVSESVPEFDAVSQTVKLRLEAENPGLALKPDMFVDVQISITMPAGLTVPKEAVMDLGNKKSVFVASEDGIFAARAIQTGWRSGGRVQVVSGLKPGDKVVVAGQFLIDSETRMQAHP
jgi:membrane fusion protein, copper/silver efflux system